MTKDNFLFEKISKMLPVSTCRFVCRNFFYFKLSEFGCCSAQDPDWQAALCSAAKPKSSRAPVSAAAVSSESDPHKSLTKAFLRPQLQVQLGHSPGQEKNGRKEERKNQD